MAGGVLARLHRNVRGNVAVMMAVMLVPLMLFVGSAVDVSRVYTVKARLQQACDAGVLAGRRTMTGTSTTLDTYAVGQANSFFRNNFHHNQAINATTQVPDLATQGSPGWMQTVPAPDKVNAGKYLPVFTTAKTSEGQVSGTATIQVPMAIMRMFGFQPVVLTATCEARYDTADADIMFVLDVTGSMACYTSDSVSNCNGYAGNSSNQVTLSDGSTYVKEKPASGSDQARIVGLRAAVLTFFDTVTDPSNVDPSTNFRFGFVPYNATVNVGKTLKTLGFIRTGTVNYQTRVYTAEATTTNQNTGSTTGTLASCAVTTTPTRNPTQADTYNIDNSGNASATYTTVTYTAGSKSNNGTCTTSVRTVIPQYTYKQNAWDVTNYVNNSSADNPATVGAQTNAWQGCIEERIDSSSDNQTSFSYTSPPKDLDPDPNPTSSADYWTPWWPDVEFYRINTTSEVVADNNRTIFSRAYLYNNQWYWSYDAGRAYNEVACPAAPAKRLTDTTLPGGSSSSAKSTVRQKIVDYLDFTTGKFRAYGTTYHDVGMLWGLRLISPTGMFAGDTVAWTGHNAPNRFIIFLTDGDMESDPVGDGGVYSANGMEKFDSRVANGATGDTLDNYHNARFTALCQMAKNRNIKIFTIAYAQTKTPQLTACASPGQDYYASDADGLKTAFTAIAKQVAMLRISK